MVGWPFVYTVLTVGLALALGFVGGVTVSVVLRPDGPLGATLRPLIIVWSAVPAYLLCYWTIQAVNRVVHSWIGEGVMNAPEWFPLPQTETGIVPYLLAALVLSVGDATLGDLLRGVDRELAVLSGRRYIHSARARGASILRHGAAEFSVFVTGVFTSRLVFLLGGVVIVEMLFSLSGAGALLWEAAEQRDYTVVMGVTYLSTLVVIAAMFFSDLYQFLVDPRVNV
jgi:ABC-type dipeptide/oligopeptide/nickel transport system permease component